MKTFKLKKLTLGVLVAIGTLTGFNAIADEVTGSDKENVDNLEVIQVSGIRGSIVKATQVKQNADAIVDAISAEDIGKFPDQNLAESLQRISGVQISRNRGEGQDVSVRGLSPDFTRVQFNGRTMPSATGGRSFDFTILPSEFVSSIEVFKTPSADLEEGGLSATVNVSTPRPLNIGKQSIVANVKAVHETNASATDPALSVLYTDVNDNSTFGYTIGLHHDRRTVESHIFEAFGLEPASEASKGLDYNLDGDLDDSFRFNHASNFSPLHEDRERTTAIATLQWRPSEGTDIWLETLFSKFDVEGALPLNSFRWTNVSGAVTDSGIVSDPLGSDGLIEYLQIDGVDNRNNARTTDSSDKLISISLGTKIDLSEDLIMEAELAYGKSERTTNSLAHSVIGRASASYNIADDYAGIPDVEYFGGYDPLDPSNFRSMGFNGNIDQPTEDKNLDLRVDFDQHVDFNLSDSFSITSIEYGAKYSDREKFNGYRRLAVSAETLAGLLGEEFDPNIEGGSFDASAYMTQYNPDDFFDGYDGNAVFPTTWLTGDVSTLLQHVSLSDLVANGTLTEGGPSEILVSEAVLAGYLKANFAGFDDKLSGNIGVRVVNTSQESTGNIPDYDTVKFDQGGAVTIVDSSYSSMERDYTEVLPSLNINYLLTDEFQIRFGMARVMSRPDLSVLSASANINVNVKSIQSGNPNVDPYIADQIDLSFEWYFEEGGMLSFAPFIKSIDSFIVSAINEQVVTYTDVDGNNPTTETFNLFQPDNGSGTDIVGYEINWQQPLDILIEGAGFMANYTSVDADDIQTAEGGPLLPLDGLSEESYNLVAYYENDLFGARLAYNYRDKFVNNGTNYFGDGSFTDDYSQLDFSASINITEDISLNVEALNLTNEVLIQTNSLNINRGLEDVGTRYTLGLRAAF